MDPEDFPTGFKKTLDDAVERIEAEEGPAPEGFPFAWNEAEADPNEDDKEKLEAALSCGPECASNVLATRYAKILRQERLLALAASALAGYETAMVDGSLLTPGFAKNINALNDRGAAIRRQIDEERGNPA